MFSSEADSGRDGVDGIGGGPLVPTRFVWPYGGRRVFLVGSFTRWSEQLPMTPVEGCPTVFQAICSLTPGFHQYKFNVDGQWHYDERQPFVTGSYGIVNTVLLTREPDPVPSIMTPDSTVCQMNIDVDNETIQRVFLQV